MGDRFEEEARALAHSVEPMDFGSSQAIRLVANLLRERGIDGR